MLSRSLSLKICPVTPGRPRHIFATIVHGRTSSPAPLAIFNPSTFLHGLKNLRIATFSLQAPRLARGRPCHLFLLRPQPQPSGTAQRRREIRSLRESRCADSGRRTSSITAQFSMPRQQGTKKWRWTIRLGTCMFSFCSQRILCKVAVGHYHAT